MTNIKHKTEQQTIVTILWWKKIENKSFKNIYKTIPIPPVKGSCIIHWQTGWGQRWAKWRSTTLYLYINLGQVMSVTSFTLIKTAGSRGYSFFLRTLENSRYRPQCFFYMVVYTVAAHFCNSRSGSFANWPYLLRNVSHPQKQNQRSRPQFF